MIPTPRDALTAVASLPRDEQLDAAHRGAHWAMLASGTYWRGPWVSPSDAAAWRAVERVLVDACDALEGLAALHAADPTDELLRAHGLGVAS